MVNHRHYPHYWEADVVLRDGGTAHLRPILPSDVEGLQQFHLRQSPSSVYLRFFTYKSRLTARELTRFTTVDYQDRVAFVTTIGDEIIGVGRYDRLDDPAEAEVAFNIADRHQGRGLGSILLEHLAAAAREHGIRRFSAEVLPENRKMLTVFSDAGYAVERHFDDGVVTLAFTIDPTEKSRAVMETREHRAEARSVADLLAPASVAVVGASREPGAVGFELLAHIVEGGFTGPVYAINPDALELAGMIAHPRIGDVPQPVQLAIIAVPYEHVAAVVEECAAAGVSGLLVATAGYADDGERGLLRQRALVAQARSNGIRVIGPASAGIINTNADVSLNASLAPSMPQRGGLGLFSQSAAIGVMLYAAASRRSLGLSSLLSAGNRADVSGNDLMQYWEDDPDTSAVGLYLESIGNPRKFSRIARRLSASKPVIVAKSEVMGLQLPPGHAVRTSQAPAGALDAMFRQSGVIRVESTEQLLDVAQLFAGQAIPQGPGVAVFSNSSALGKVVADNAGVHQLLTEDLAVDLDLETDMSEALQRLRSRLRRSLNLPQVHAVVAAFLPARTVTTGQIAAVLYECASDAGKPVVVSFTGTLDPAAQVEGLIRPAVVPAHSEPAHSEPPHSEPASDKPAVGELGTDPAKADGIPSYASPGAAVAAVSEAVRYGEWLRRDHGEFVQPAGIDPQAARTRLEELLAGVRGDRLRRLVALDTAELLGYYGIEVLPSIVFDTAEEAVTGADALGWPVAIKTVDGRLRQRLDLGGVRLNITDAESLRRNVGQMKEALKPYGVGTLEVQSMAAAGQGCRLRAMEDPLLGPVLSFGLSGDAVNLLDDWSHRVPPLTTVDVTDLVRGPRAARKLFGYEGLPAVDIAALEDLVSRVAVLKDEHPEIAVVEFNPVLVSTAGVSVLSASIDVGSPARRTDSARRAMRD